MLFPRSHGRVARFLWPHAGVLLLAFASQTAQAQSQEPPPPTPPAVPAATLAPNNTGPSVPAAGPVSPASRPAIPAYAREGEAIRHDTLGSAYIPVDSPVYPMALRLYSLGYLDSAFINMRPWTRRSLLHMLEESSPAIIAGGNDQAIDLLAKLDAYIASEGAENTISGPHFNLGDVYGVESLYTRDGHRRADATR